MAKTNVKENIEESFEDCADNNFIFFIKKDFVAFKGHFPGYPLLPGIVQIEMGMFCIRKILSNPCAVLKEVKKIKFLKPILPDTRVFVSVLQAADNFKITIRDEKKTYSQMSVEVGR
jgi:3-hydroxymyristoyl/3-hydroxydecanoyl-(acyl carrier protein) dehydratase